MDIGTKIKQARLSANITQEQAAEALGVSRQTISNWENNKTYPDIVSVIKMSDLYDVSLDCLLKEKEKPDMSNYISYLKKSTDSIKSRAKLMKTILISTYLCIWSFALIVFWLFADGSDAMGFGLVFFAAVLPLSTFVISFVIGKNNFWGRAKWLSVAVFGIMYMLADYLTYRLASMLLNSYADKIILPELGLLFVGTAVSALGLLLGMLFNRLKNKEK